MAKAVGALDDIQSKFKNMVLQFEDDFLMYGQYNLKITESRIDP